MSKFKPDPDQLYRDNQIINLKYILDSLDWDKLEYEGDVNIIDDNMNVTQQNKFVQFYTTFDVIDKDCIIHPDKPHNESFKYLPSYIVGGDYGKYLIHKETKYKEMIKTGYKILDFKFPNTVNVHISPITKLKPDENLQFINRIGEQTEFTSFIVKVLTKQIEKSIKFNSLPYNIKINTLDKKIKIEIFSNEISNDTDPLFRFHFGPIKSLEIVMIQGLQVDSSKIYHC
jgi:hypothetical protein